MKRIFLTLILTVLITANLTRAASPITSDQFESRLDLGALRSVAVMDQQTVKTLDSYARQELERITGKSTFDGHDPVFTLLDIVNHPDDYQTANLIKIRNLPLRTEFRTLGSISSEEQERIVKTGMVSLELLNQQDVKDLFAKVQSSDIRKAEACQQVIDAYQHLRALCFSVVSITDLFLPASVVPPAAGSADPGWHHLIDIVWNDPAIVARAKGQHTQLPPPLPGYTADDVKPSLAASDALRQGWKNRDADAVNSSSIQLADALAHINPVVYPSELIRHVEVVYNKLTKMTLPGAAVYFFAFLFFLMSANSGVSSLRLWGLRLLVIGFVIHTTGILIRWWLEGSIPIKNEFESVMFSAWFGVCVGLLIELGVFGAVRRIFTGPTEKYGAAGYGIIGAAASFVGFLSLVAIFTVPYVFHVTIGENVGQVNGVLMSYWLYIHVTMVTASYSMIGMAFVLGCWWLIKYYVDYGSISRLSSRALESAGHGFEPVFPTGGGTGASAASLGLSGTLARMVFFPVSANTVAINEPARKIRAADKVLQGKSANFLATLDACNLVVLQLAFWTLGVGIVLGAIWADQSWGRFWAWDPKETFALVTWIAYLMIVHVRVATQDKAWWTAVLSIGGFFLMLFNWIGVNYFLPGLHSYAG
jgi:cytochrome c-type biogenesis protein CcsB